MTNRTRTNRSRTAIAAFVFVLVGVLGGVALDSPSDDGFVEARKAGRGQVEY